MLYSKLSSPYLCLTVGQILHCHAKFDVQCLETTYRERLGPFISLTDDTRTFVVGKDTFDIVELIGGLTDLISQLVDLLQQHNLVLPEQIVCDVCFH